VDVQTARQIVDARHLDDVALREGIPDDPRGQRHCTECCTRCLEKSATVGPHECLRRMVETSSRALRGPESSPPYFKLSRRSTPCPNRGQCEPSCLLRAAGL